ncbi:hypothetical protein JTE90_012279 [Oedothorax gibbosus]|uniref:EF-hand domain-containing protein n=1 Tax=Oedothorax gibbosus TaxID=931172 RepID=A0AAV6VLA0_9ARAC|nr:hypothetical protein JTE90_012279 [Oedothorax gibbosus]
MWNKATCTCVICLTKINLMSRSIFVFLLVLVTLELVVGPPVDQKKKDAEKKDEKKESEEMDDFGLEYGRYLQQVVQALEEDKDFAAKLVNISTEQIKSGHIAKELEFVKHNVRTKLDELKRIEVDRLRKLIRDKMDRQELGLDRKNGVKIPKHLDVDNPHSFEIEDLKKLIQTATNDLEQLDKQRREEFKKYELEKEATYREGLKNMTEEQRKEAEKHHQELVEKHKDHPKVHHPGSKPQLEQVWEENDHMPKEEFNPKTFFAMHDINGDGHLDVDEIEAILIPEVKKLYNPNNEEDDPAEMVEEFHRMREHIFNETDKNKDALISLEEFLQMTEQQDFQKDDGWKGLDEQNVYTDQELEEYMRQRQMGYGDPRMYYDVNGVPYQVPPGGMPHQPYPDPQFQQGYPQGHPQQFQQGHPQQFPQGHPQQFPQGHPQQFPQGHPQQFQQGHPQQQFQPGHPQQGIPQQQFQQGHPQQGIPQQQFQQGHPQQQFQQGHPQQGIPQQQFQQVHPQQGIPQQQGHPQQGVPQQQFQQGHPQQGIPHQQFQQGQVPPQQQIHQAPQQNLGSNAAVPPQAVQKPVEHKANEVPVQPSTSQEIPQSSQVVNQVPPKSK